jgi:formiminotetrahydrofolate cyclodeaminase
VPISDDKIGDFLERLADRVPAPAGGAASALQAAIGAALLTMVARFSTRGQSEQDAATIGRVITESGELRGLALRLADADAEAYATVIGALKLPRATDAEQEARADAVSKALVNASWPPAQVISVAGMVVDLAEALVGIGNRNVLGDAVAAAEAARAATATARVNVEINLADITDEHAGLEMLAQAGQADEIIARAGQITRTVRSQLRS